MWVVRLVELEVGLDVFGVGLLGRLVVGPAVGESAGGGVVGAAFGRRRARLEILGIGFGDKFFFLFLGLAVLADHRRGEALADDLRADELAFHIHPLSVCVARE